MASEIELRVDNPTDDLRNGPVSEVYDVIPDDLLRDSKSLMLVSRDQPGAEIPVQFERLDTCDANRYSISFVLVDPIAKRGQEVYFILPSDQHFFQQKYLPQDAAKAPPKVEIYNHQLFVSLTLAPRESLSEPNCFAGSARSVRLRGREMLDSFCVGWERHDPEKRCMQIDELQVWHGNSRCPVDKPLFGYSYELISQQIGPVRTVVTLDSAPFSCRCPGLRTFDVRLRRVFTIYAGADYVMEELALCGDTPLPDDLEFTVRYYANMDLDPLWPGHRAVYPETFPADWLVLGDSSMGHHFTQSPGYGFASDVKVVSLTHPHDDCVGPSPRVRTFSWKLARCRKAKCIHVFMRRGFVPDGDFNNHVGRLWDAHVARPLRLSFSMAATARQT